MRSFILGLFSVLFLSSMSHAQDCPGGQCPIRTIVREVASVPVNVVREVVPVAKAAVKTAVCTATAPVRAVRQARCSGRLIRRCR